MGTWGTAIFSDDLAADIRSEFKDYIGDGLSPSEATAAILRDYKSSIGDYDEDSVLWLSLAATQWSLGRLQPEIKAKAQEIIDSGQDLRRWEDDPKLQSKRGLVLQKLSAKLESDLPHARRVPKRYRNDNKWERGQIIAYRMLSGEYCLFRVIGHHIDAGGKSAIAEILDWSGTNLPSKREMKRLGVKTAKHGTRQLTLGGVSAREYPAARLIETDIFLPVTQKPGSCLGSTWKYLDKILSDRFLMGDPKST